MNRNMLFFFTCACFCFVIVTKTTLLINMRLKASKNISGIKPLLINFDWSGYWKKNFKMLTTIVEDLIADIMQISGICVLNNHQIGCSPENTKCQPLSLFFLLFFFLFFNIDTRWSLFQEKTGQPYFYPWQLTESSSKGHEKGKCYKVSHWNLCYCDHQQYWFVTN